VCAVGATDELDKRAGFSNTGRHVDLMAPGVAILRQRQPFDTMATTGWRCDSWDGKSMATPFVAGVAALVLAKWPDLTPAQVIRKLTSSADRVAGAKKGSTSYGAGRLNCEKALR
jgi:subtilisin family serine protease